MLQFQNLFFCLILTQFLKPLWFHQKLEYAICETILVSSEIGVCNQISVATIFWPDGAPLVELMLDKEERVQLMTKVRKPACMVNFQLFWPNFTWKMASFVVMVLIFSTEFDIIH